MNYPPNSLLTGRAFNKLRLKSWLGVLYFIGKKVDMMLKIKYIVIATSVFKSSFACANTVYDITM